MTSWKHNPLSRQAGAPPAAGRPGGFAWEAGQTQHVVYRGMDDQVHELWFKRGGLNPEWKYGGALTTQAGAPPAAGDPFGFAWNHDATQHVVYRGADNQIHELWFKQAGMNPKWQYGGALTKKAGAPAAAGEPYGFAWEEEQTLHVFYRGADNNVHELWFSKDDGGQWRHGGALNSKAGAPAAAGASRPDGRSGEVAGFVWTHDRSQHIIYQGVDHHIHELWFQTGARRGEWKHSGALNVMAGGPPAAGDAMGFAWEADNTQHVVYRGRDNQIDELWFAKDASGHWKYGGAISAKTGAPPADGMPYGYAWEKEKSMHIVYRGQNQQVHELWFEKGFMQNAWKYAGAISKLAGAPDAASDPVGFAWEGENSQHVIYRGVDNDIHELWFKK